MGKRKGLSPTQRTLRALREQGRVCAIVEKWNQFAGPHGIRQDLFGFIDIIALDPQHGIVGIQSCGNARAAHRKKILDSECTANVIEWLKSGGKIELWSWSQRLVKRGGTAMRYTANIEPITYLDIVNTKGET